MAFEPKEPVELDPPKDTPFTKEELSRHDGIKSPTLYVGVKGVVFDVTKNVKAYGPGTSYHVFTGKEASRGLAKSSLEPEDNRPDISDKIDDLSEKELGVLDDWYTFFSKRYNIVGRVVD